MSDDLVKRLRDPNGLADSVLSENERKEAADRIEELEAGLSKAIELLGEWRLAASGYLTVQAVINKHDATLKELKGGDQ